MYVYCLKIHKKVYLTIFIWFLLLVILFNSKICFEATKISVNLFLYNVFPAIFPFIVLTEFLIKSNLINYLSIGKNKIICKIFNISYNSVPVIILGSLFGYPNSIRYATHLLENNKIQKNEYLKLLSFTNNPSIMYILSSIGVGMFSNIKVGFVLFASSFVSSVIIGICYRPSFDNIIQQTKIMSNSFIKKQQSYFQILVLSIQKTFLSLSFILAFMIIFTIIPNVLIKVFDITNNLSKLLFGLFEITSGCNVLISSNFSLKHIIVLISFIINFSSIMIIFELYNESKKHISFKRILIFKFLQGIIASLITWAILQFVNIWESIPVFAKAENHIEKKSFISLIICFQIFFYFYIYVNCKKKMTGKNQSLKGDNV